MQIQQKISVALAGVTAAAIAAVAIGTPSSSLRGSMLDEAWDYVEDFFSADDNGEYVEDFYSGGGDGDVDVEDVQQVIGQMPDTADLSAQLRDFFLSLPDGPLINAAAGSHSVGPMTIDITGDSILVSGIDGQQYRLLAEIAVSGSDFAEIPLSIIEKSGDSLGTASAMVSIDEIDLQQFVNVAQSISYTDTEATVDTPMGSIRLRLVPVGQAGGSSGDNGQSGGGSGGGSDDGDDDTGGTDGDGHDGDTAARSTLTEEIVAFVRALPDGPLVRPEVAHYPVGPFVVEMGPDAVIISRQGDSQRYRLDVTSESGISVSLNDSSKEGDKFQIAAGGMSAPYPIDQIDGSLIAQVAQSFADGGNDYTVDTELGAVFIRLVPLGDGGQAASSEPSNGSAPTRTPSGTGEGTRNVRDSVEPVRAAVPAGATSPRPASPGVADRPSGDAAHGAADDAGDQDEDENDVEQIIDAFDGCAAEGDDIDSIRQCLRRSLETLERQQPVHTLQARPAAAPASLEDQLMACLQSVPDGLIFNSGHGCGIGSLEFVFTAGNLWMKKDDKWYTLGTVVSGSAYGTSISVSLNQAQVSKQGQIVTIPIPAVNVSIPIPAQYQSLAQQYGYGSVYNTTVPASQRVFEIGMFDISELFRGLEYFQGEFTSPFTTSMLYEGVAATVTITAYPMPAAPTGW